MEGFEGFNLEVDSVTDLGVPIADESSIGVGANEQHIVRSVVTSGAGSFCQIETRAMVIIEAHPVLMGITSMPLGTAGVPRVSDSRLGLWLDLL